MKGTRNCYLLGTAIILVWFIGSANAAVINWPTAVEATFPGPETILGDPSTHSNSVLFANGATATYSGFNDGIFYDTTELAAALGVSDTFLASANFIAFDGNGSPVGFESSTWVFSDGVNTITHPHNFGDGPNGALIANSYLLTDSYNTIFNATYNEPGAPYVGFAIFDLIASGINPYSDQFSATIIGGSGDLGIHAPDLVALGVIDPTVVPIPAAIWLFGSGLLGLLGISKIRSR